MGKHRVTENMLKEHLSSKPKGAWCTYAFEETTLRVVYSLFCKGVLELKPRFMMRLRVTHE